MTQQDPVVGAGRGELADTGEGGLQGGGAGQVETGQGKAGGGGVHMGVGEGRGDQGAVEIDHLVHAVGEGVGRALGTDPGDVSRLDDHRRGEGVRGAVDLAAAEQDGLGGLGGAVAHSRQFLSAPGGSRTGGARRAPGAVGAAAVRSWVAVPRTVSRGPPSSASRPPPASAAGPGVPPVRAGWTRAP